GEGIDQACQVGVHSGSSVVRPRPSAPSQRCCRESTEPEQKVCHCLGVGWTFLSDRTSRSDRNIQPTSHWPWTSTLGTWLTSSDPRGGEIILGHHVRFFPGR